MAYIYPLNNPGGVHLMIFYFTHLSPPPNIRPNRKWTEFEVGEIQNTYFI